MSVDETVLNLCVWYKTQKLSDDKGSSLPYIKCNHVCNGYDKACLDYVSKQAYLKAKLETCKRINAKTNNVDKETD